jgi:polysaccharide pyruvyl transferase WcaK-like protein
MHVLVKGYYGYKNLGDELILFALLTRIEEMLNPDQISLLA